ncbi:hypothetical protein LWC34_34550 [Kibdelosporangium philippinense]|uniref:Uncharacterized protein n=1 Tax=Kibdelosporangium philippinense TaxID=211113 RepID=A0ABS8ZJC6_9PSEU|nr:hypothetical protein [Kibdelosporangium philippinense]MCE7007905.1 hypothetical protein [Kibdelosporangium philippinense]
MRTVDRVGYIIGGLLFLSGLVHLVVLLITGSTWLGPLSMRKPMTFGLSFGLTVGAAVWATSFLRIKHGLRTFLLAVLYAASIVEVGLITMQAWRGHPSHFNFETPFDSTISMTLAGGGFVLIAVTIGFTVAAFRTVQTRTMQLALRFGFAALLVALAVGAVMIATGVTAVRSGDPQLAYATAGALKPAHAVPMHAILIMPGLAWLLGFTRWPEQTQVLLMRIAAVGYGLLIAGTIVYFAL